MIESTIAIIWLFLPAGFSNMIAANSRHLKFLSFLNIPVDMGITLKGERLLGKNKTVRGFICGTLFGAIGAYFQMVIYNNIGLDKVFSFNDGQNYEGLHVVLFGAAIGFGALFGDSVESFFKRRVGIQPGQPWFPFDQIDYIVGSLVFSLPFIMFDFGEYLALFLFYFLGHLVIKYVGFIIGVEDKKI